VLVASATMAMETRTGVDRERVTAWLTEHVAGVVAPFDFRLIAGGRSNLTYEVVDAEQRRFVLRRPPLGNVLPSAHDMGREHRIISALAPTPVPVATPLGYCADTTVTGAPFYVMAFVDGAVLRTADETEPRLDEARRRRFARSLVDVLADLHGVDPDAVGLGGLGRRDGYVERQLRRWKTQFEGAKTRDVPALDEAHRRLSEDPPRQQRTAIVHGDFRTENCIVGDDGSVAAILDWELCTLGDPLADLAWLLAYWMEPGESPEDLLIRTPTTLPGFPTRAEVAAQYVARTGADTRDLDRYIALSYWKLGCIAEGVYARYAAGVMGADDLPEPGLSDVPPRLGRKALDVLDRMG
jgi:aminoglycoside phosphotransferase (APT) family kinase protein